MKNIRHTYLIHFTGRGVITTVNVKGETLKDIYHKLLAWEPALERISDRSQKCTIWEYHKLRKSEFLVEREHNGGFLPCHILSDKDYNYLLRHGI